MKRIFALALAAAMLLSVSGCGVFSNEYYWSEPFNAEQRLSEAEGTEVRNYSTLRAAILELIYAGTEHGQFRFGSYNGSLIDDLAAVCVEIKSSNPIGAYAVEDISYDSSRIVSYYTADISIEYKKSPAEIAAVKSVSGLAELSRHICESMASFEERSVVRVYSYAVDEDYFRTLVHSLALQEPLAVLIEPEVEIRSYPESGPERIYEIDFSYTAPSAVLRSMADSASKAAAELAAALGEGDSLSLALRAAEALTELESQEEPAELSAYAALLRADKRPLSLALAYKLLCAELGINAAVVEGVRGLSVHYWNIIELEGENYHVDISRLTAEPYKAFLLSDADMEEEHAWERGDYPACDGPLGPVDAFGPPPVEEQPPETTPGPDQGGEPEEPEQSPAPEGDGQKES